MKKSFDELVQDLLGKYQNVFKALADGQCPLCKKRLHGVRYNLGEKYAWFEGCRECYDFTQRHDD